MSEIGLELLEGLRQVLDEEEEKDVMLRFSKTSVPWQRNWKQPPR